MNNRCGFKRIGLVVWVLYAVSIPAFLFVETSREYGKAVGRDIADWSGCRDYVRVQIACKWERDSLCADTVTKACDAELKRNEDRDADVYGPLAPYRHAGWNLLWIAPVALFIPPLIVYGTLRGLIALASWIMGGFREYASRQT